MVTADVYVQDQWITRLSAAVASGIQVGDYLHVRFTPGRQPDDNGPVIRLCVLRRELLFHGDGRQELQLHCQRMV